VLVLVVKVVVVVLVVVVVAAIQWLLGSLAAELAVPLACGIPVPTTGLQI